MVIPCNQFLVKPSTLIRYLLGFPPTIGPCYVNFYGSPREFSSVDEYEGLNEGQVCYIITIKFSANDTIKYNF